MWRKKERLGRGRKKKGRIKAIFRKGWKKGKRRGGCSGRSRRKPQKRIKRESNLKKPKEVNS